MSARFLAEGAAFLILDEIKSKIASALTTMRSTRTDNKVSTEVPQSYFYYETAKGFVAPAIFVIPEDIDFRKQELGANHINAYVRIRVMALVEDYDSEKLTLKAWRYQDALHEILDQKTLESSGGNVKIACVVKGASFSPIYTESDDMNNARAIFRKEATLDCEIHHFEKT